MSAAVRAFQGQGYAPNYSLACEQASAEVHRASTYLLETLRSAYPRDALALIHHPRGSFEATVIGWDSYGARVVVRNNVTGKASKWWFARVSLIQAGQEGGAA